MAAVEVHIPNVGSGVAIADLRIGPLAAFDAEVAARLHFGGGRDIGVPPVMPGHLLIAHRLALVYLEDDLWHYINSVTEIFQISHAVCIRVNDQLYAKRLGALAVDPVDVQALRVGVDLHEGAVPGSGLENGLPGSGPRSTSGSWALFSSSVRAFLISGGVLTRFGGVTTRLAPDWQRGHCAGLLYSLRERHSSNGPQVTQRNAYSGTVGPPHVVVALSRSTDDNNPTDCKHLERTEWSPHGQWRAQCDDAGTRKCKIPAPQASGHRCTWSWAEEVSVIAI